MVEEALSRQDAVSAITHKIPAVDRDQIFVLVVDDVLPIVEEMLTLLELRNIPAAAAASLAEAIFALEECSNISVIICDVRLGRDSGFDLIERAKTNETIAHRKLEYVFVTGDLMGIGELPNDLNLTIMTKPVRPRELLGLINERLKKRLLM